MQGIISLNIHDSVKINQKLSTQKLWSSIIYTVHTETDLKFKILGNLVQAEILAVLAK